MDDDSDWRWWVRHVIVPILTGGGLVGALLIAHLGPPPATSTLPVGQVQGISQATPSVAERAPPAAQESVQPPDTEAAPSMPVTSAPPTDPIPNKADPPAVSADAPTSVGSGSDEAAALKFVNDYFEVWDQPNADMLARLPALYASDVMFYGETTSRAAIMDLKEKFAARWPIRHYTIVPGSAEIFCSLGRCNVRTVVRFTTESNERGKVSRGTASMGFGVSGGVVVEETSQMLRRDPL